MIGENFLIKPLNNLFTRLFKRGEANTVTVLARDAYQRDSVDAAIKHFKAGKPLPRVDLTGALSADVESNKFFKELLAQWTPEGQQAGNATLQRVLGGGGYQVKQRYDLASDLAQQIPHTHRHPSGGSMHVEFESRYRLAKDQVLRAERLQAGAMLGGPQRFDEAFQRLYDGMGQALKTKDRAAFGKYMQALRPDMKASGVDYFFGQGYSIGNMNSVWDFVHDGLTTGLVGGDQAMLGRLKALGTFG